MTAPVRRKRILHGARPGRRIRVDGAIQLGPEGGPRRQTGETGGVLLAVTQSMAFMDDVLFSYYQAPMIQGDHGA
ncbi:hypothetical protein CXQ81_23920 [Pseudomonas sp. 09C 129]|nr:hypothetical protein CXQ81_23920 [Pseudomonas sp. 09C 129]